MIKRTKQGQDIRTRKQDQKFSVFCAKQTRRILQNLTQNTPPTPREGALAPKVTPTYLYTEFWKRVE